MCGAYLEKNVIFEVLMVKTVNITVSRDVISGSLINYY
jgi:hypothetical protein